ncbi:MAG TPA: hypothetical protein VJM49_18765, partial [Acidimicrobiales bacterium]|nr:hypothetical protein [Acidimicrobiales bacterium]
VEAGEQAEGDAASEQAEGDEAAEAVQPVVRPEPVAGVVRPEPAPPPLPTPPVAPSPVAPSAVPPPPVAPRPVAEVRRHRARLVAGVVVVLLGIGVGAALAGGSDEDDTAAPETTTTTEQVTTATTSPPLSAATVFARAADELVDAGSFTYSGTVSATDISHVRPMLWLGVESTVNGEVSLGLGQVHELAVTDGERASETITAGPAVWGRRTSELATLGEAVYEPVPELSEAEGTPTVRGAALLPTWLAATTAPSDLGRDPAGRRTFVGTVPAATLGPVERGADAADGQLTLSVGPDGTPAHIELVTLSGPSFRLTIDLTNLGRTVVIQPPAPPAA